MNWLAALVLGVVQGLTEFLPVSSSGHLVLVQSLIPGFSQPGVLFDVILHLGTVLAVLVYFRKDLCPLLKRDWQLFVVGSIPVALVGFFFQDAIEGFFGSLRLVGVAFLVTAILNFVTDRVKTHSEKISLLTALGVGIAQAAAIIPGISRSGATIFAGAVQGVKRSKAAEFSFLLSIPAILGANLLQIVKYGLAFDPGQGYYFFGFASAFATGLVAIYLTLKTLTERKFIYFAVYVAVLGVLALVL